MITKVKLNSSGYTKKYNNGINTSIVGSYANDEEVQGYIANGGMVEPEFTAEELALQAEEEARQAKIEALRVLTVTTTAGNVFDADEKALINMLSAIQASGVLGITSHDWKLADNSIVNITLDELKEAHSLAIQAVGAITLGA